MGRTHPCRIRTPQAITDVGTATGVKKARLAPNQALVAGFLAIFFPIMAFVAMGFDHVVANMFFLPAAIFAGVDGITWWDAIHNWIFAVLGNLVGAAVFVAASYYFLIR